MNKKITTIDKNFLLNKVKWTRVEYSYYEDVYLLCGKYQNNDGSLTNIFIEKAEFGHKPHYTLIIGRDNMNELYAKNCSVNEELDEYDIFQNDLNDCYYEISRKIELEKEKKDRKKFDKYNILLK